MFPWTSTAIPLASSAPPPPRKTENSLEPLGRNLVTKASSVPWMSKIGRAGAPRDIRVADRIHGHGVGVVESVPAVIGRIDQRRIDHQLFSTVVGAEAETAFVAVQSPTAGNRNAFPGDFLIDHRFLVPVFIPARPDDEVALFRSIRNRSVLSKIIRMFCGSAPGETIQSYSRLPSFP